MAASQHTDPTHTHGLPERLHPERLRERLALLRSRAERLAIDVSLARRHRLLGSAGVPDHYGAELLRAFAELGESLEEAGHPCNVADAAAPTAEGAQELLRHLRESHGVAGAGSRSELEEAHAQVRRREALLVAEAEAVLERARSERAG